jgi:glycosyltransferase involved in cell wall biosynthesis
MIPVPKRHLSGGGLRAWSLGEGLKSKGHEVVYSIPQKIADDENVPQELLAHAFEPEKLSKIIRKVFPDIILFEQWGLATYLEETSVPVVIDLHGSLILENYYRKHRNFYSDAAAKFKAFVKADFIICPSERQKNYFLPWLMLSGFQIDTMRIGVIPVSLSPELPKKRQLKRTVFIFGGSLWPWINPFPSLNIVSEEIRKKRKGRLKFFSQVPDLIKVLPKDDDKVKTTIDFKAFKNKPGLEFVGLISHDNLLKEYLKATAAVDVYQKNRERELAFSTRTIEYLWCGLPVLHADYSELAPLIRRYNAGWCLDPNDKAGIKKAVDEILDQKEKVKKYSQNAQKLVKENFTWDRTIAPLHEFVTNPRSEAKNKTFFERATLEFDRLEEQLQADEMRLKETISSQQNEIDNLTTSYQTKVQDLEREIWRLNNELQMTQKQFIEDTKKHYTEKELFRKKHENEIRNLEDRIFELNSELKKREDELGAFAATVEELEHTLADLKVSENRYKEQIQHHNSQIEAQRRTINERDKSIYDHNETIQGLKEELSGYHQSLLERDNQLLDLRKKEEKLKEKYESSQKIIAGKNEEEHILRQNLHNKEEEVRYLQGILNSIQNRLLYRSYRVITYRLKRIFFQYPKLFYLIFINVLTNIYMSRWSKKKGQRIFPAQ